MKIKRFIGGNLESNGYVLYQKEGGKAYIIDPGYQPDRFLKFLREKELCLEGILLTHHHHDHVGGVDKIEKETGCRVYIHVADGDRYRKPASFFEDGKVFDLEGEGLRAIATPGHTEGGVCYFSEKSKLVFTGDTIFNIDVGRVDLEDGNLKKMRDSINLVVRTWGNDVTIYPGHGESASMKFVRENNNEYLELLDR